MSGFFSMRNILSDPKPDLATFLTLLNAEPLKKEDLDLLLRKSVEEKGIQAHFPEYCSALVA
jgi:hypothetical protein